MVNLLAVRKRSSRLEAKERQRQEELERQRKKNRSMLLKEDLNEE